VPCIEPTVARDGSSSIAHRRGRLAAVAAALAVAACGSAPLPPVSSTRTFDAPLRDPAGTADGHVRAVAAAAAMQAAPPPALPAPTAARDWTAFRRQAAQRLVAANPHAVYDGPVPDPLLAIPVLEIELERDGSVHRIRVLRHPTQARDTTQLAIAAVQRAAPFGSVAHLPKPWTFAEVFLFDEQRRFKPRTLDAD
jgi:protein TonB